MPDPLTLAVVGSAVVTEGIKFLYGQAAEAIKRWREDRKAASGAKTAPSQVMPPTRIFAGKLAPLQIHLAQVEPLEANLLALRSALAGYADDLETFDASDGAALEAVDALRQAMEAVYQQRLTFVGEQRAASGPVAEGTLDVVTIAGRAAAVEARLIASGRVVGRVKSDRIEGGGSVFGVKADTIGGRT